MKTMTKCKKLMWFGAFCSFTQYVRDRKLSGYLLANVFSCLVPAALLIMQGNGMLAWTGYLCLTALLRVVFAPFDDYSSNEYAFSALSTYPLTIRDMMIVRLTAKVTQFSEWLYAGSVIYIYITAFPHAELWWTTALGLLTVAAIQLSEEVIFYGMFLVKRVRRFVALFLLICAAAATLSVTLPLPSVSLLTAAAVFGGILLASLAAMAILHIHRRRIRPLARRVRRKTDSRIPLSSRLMLRAAKGSALTRLVCMEWVTLLKFKLWDLVSAVGFLVVFSLIDKEGSTPYVLVQYLIVDYCFLVGFNHFGNINDPDGLFLFCTLDRKTRIRSKNLAMAVVLFVISTVATVALWLLQGLSLKALVLTLISNLFCIAVIVLIASVISIRHFHLNESKKKYTVSNMAVMLGVLLLTSVVTAFLFAGGILAAISLLFMVIVTLTCLYFALIDVSLSERLFRRREASMIRALRAV